MVSYQTHVHVNHEVYEKYLEWVRGEYIPALLKQPGFVSAELLLRKGGALQASSKEIKIVCKIRDEEALKEYLANTALALREKGTEKFPGQFSAHREIWLESESF
jgi:hypothetical protein